MGATNFCSEGRGLTMANTFDVLVNDARYEHGHGGYTGTIAEKNGFIEVNVPAGVDVQTFMNWIENFDYEPGVVPLKHVSYVRELSRRYNDKWGPALGIKLSEPPDENGFSAFVFFGFASE